MKIAVIGTGISGNVASWLLHRDHELTIFEANDYIGGHTNTVDVGNNGSSCAVDTGFIVFNDWTYPNFIKLLDTLGVESQVSHMSFSVKCGLSGLEYNGTSLNSLFAQRRNLFNPRFHRMIRDILRFNREAPEVLEMPEKHPLTLREYLKRNGYSQQFMEHYIIPMGAAIWSAEPDRLGDIPLRFFVQFFKNHGMLSVDDRPQWRVIRGGSREYVKKLTAPFRDRIRLSNPVKEVRRFPDRVEVTPVRGEKESFDWVIMASHSNQALRMLGDANEREREILGAIPYQVNDTILHRDTGVLPKRRLAWAAWNYYLPPQKQNAVAVTYNMNILQSLPVKETYCVTLNQRQDVRKESILREYLYDHPVFTDAGVRAQGRHREISGVNRTSYCGAYWRNGFHEDGVVSALAVCEQFGRSL